MRPLLAAGVAVPLWGLLMYVVWFMMPLGIVVACFATAALIFVALMAGIIAQLSGRDRNWD
ncbi:hypothetical protein [Sinomonas sp. G460-2]|uniref:hypothetical protein n=1 Tax=Sinomonas sp. G460-2 TaxID=3393464 RepID=UPI0039EF199C